jgi:uncharacterized protein (UPF0264 family)
MTPILVKRSPEDVAAIRARGDHRDSRKAAWFAIRCGSEVIREIQQVARTKNWESLDEAAPYLNQEARAILKMRLEAIRTLKHPPHHQEGLRLSRATGTAKPRAVNALCLISGHEGQEIPGLVAYDRVMVDAEHMEQALGPATIAEIFEIRQRIGEYVYISTNVSETPQIVRSLTTGRVDTRATAALTASKVIAALAAGADVVKVGYAHLDYSKQDLTSKEVVKQMKLVRADVNQVVKDRALVLPLNLTGSYPLIGVFFPEIGIDANGERPREIAAKAIDITADGNWQGVLIDTFEKHTGRRYRDFYTLDDTKALADQAHSRGLELWIAGSISRPEVADLVKCGVDLICFGGAARSASGQRPTFGKSKGQGISRRLVTELVAEFEKADPR